MKDSSCRSSPAPHVESNTWSMFDPATNTALKKMKSSSISSAKILRKKSSCCKSSSKSLKEEETAGPYPLMKSICRMSTGAYMLFRPSYHSTRSSSPDTGQPKKTGEGEARNLPRRRKNSITWLIIRAITSKNPCNSVMIRKLELARRRKDTRIQNPPEFFMKQKNPASFQGTTDMLALTSCTILFSSSPMSWSIKISLKFPTGTFRWTLKNLREQTKLI